MTFTKNEKAVLGLLLENGRVSDVEMASSLKISTQAVGKIRKKLEENGIIEGYSCNLNYEKLGLNHFVFVLSKLKDKFWQEHGEIGAMEAIKKNPHTLLTCMPSGSSVSTINLLAFKDGKEMDRYFHLGNARNSEYQEIVKTYTFSPLHLLKNSPKELFKSILYNKPIVPQRLKRG